MAYPLRPKNLKKSGIDDENVAALRDLQRKVTTLTEGQPNQGGVGSLTWSEALGTFTITKPGGNIVPVGTVSSVAASGGTTGLTFSGSPIITSGTLVLDGTLVIANGGTGATTAAGARANLEAAKSGANSDITSLSGITGGISTPDYIDFDTTATVTRATGRLWWDNADGNQTLSLGMAGSNATLQIGEEMYFRIKASSAITEGQVVMFTGTVGNSGALTGAPATGLTKDTASYVMGVATEDIALNGWGYVTQFGLVRGIDTTGGAEAWVDGQILYYNPAVAGGLTKTVPAAPSAKVEVAAVVKAGTNGSLFIRPISRFSLTQLNDVETAAAANLDLLQYNGPGGYWEHKSPSLISVGTATNLAGGAANRIAYQTGAGATSFITAPTVANTFLEWSGSAFQWSVNPLGTVTSVSGNGSVNGITLTGSVTTSGSLTLGGTLSNVSLSSQVTGTLPIANGGTGATDAAMARSNLGAGTVTSVGGAGTVNGITLTGTVTGSGSLTLGGSLSGVSLTTQVTGTLPVANGGTGSTSLTSNALLKGAGTSAIAYSIINDVGTYAYIGAGNGGGILRIYDSQTGGGGKCITTYDYLNYTAMQFIRDNGNPANVVGTITCTDTSTSYNTSSDRRLKKDIVPAGDAGSIIDAIQIVSHGWKAGGDIVPFGVIAQELYKIAPQAVHVGDYKDEIEDVWSVDYSKLVPLLIKEVQSLRSRVAELEGK